MTLKKLKIEIPNQNGQVSIMFTRGGMRDGSGRKGFGETKKVSLTLTKDIWKEIEDRCSLNNSSKSELLRGIIEAAFNKTV